MKLLKDILYGISVDQVKGDTAVGVKQLAFDSRKVGPDTLFVAQRGLTVDGHDFIEKAVGAGAVAVICQALPLKMKDGVTYVKVDDSNRALALAASNFYDNPSAKLRLVGVTGTNGKTTIATLLYTLFQRSGRPSGLLSTIRMCVGEKNYGATHTTPDSLTINRMLREMADQGIEYCFMEVSSHGIDQKRTAGLTFEGGIFTNLTHDHLDYHGDFASYRDTKKIFFDELDQGAFALFNADDKNGPVMVQNTRARKLSYALKSMADYRARILENQFDGLLLSIDGHELWTRLIGSFNAYNLLAIYAAADQLGMETQENLRQLSQLENVQGRFQHWTSGSGIHVIVDYAHTPDALKNVLGTINSIRTMNEQVITVVGCGGDRDKAKRPKIGNIASTLSTQVIFTSDNPRSEDPGSILEEIEKGVRPEHYKKTISVLDRKQAIKTACSMAQKGDIILVAGKGHETYQLVGDQRLDFDDFQIVKGELTKMNK